MNQKTEITKGINHLIKNLLAEQIGVEPDDIKGEDTFADDLHMTATNLSDFVESLSTKGIDTTNIDLTEITTVEDLIELLSSQEPIE